MVTYSLLVRTESHKFVHRHVNIWWRSSIESATGRPVRSLVMPAAPSFPPFPRRTNPLACSLRLFSDRNFVFSDELIHSLSLRFASLTSLRESGRFDAPCLSQRACCGTVQVPRVCARRGRLPVFSFQGMRDALRVSLHESSLCSIEFSESRLSCTTCWFCSREGWR